MAMNGVVQRRTGGHPSMTSYNAAAAAAAAAAAGGMTGYAAAGHASMKPEYAARAAAMPPKYVTSIPLAYLLTYYSPD